MAENVSSAHSNIALARQPVVDSNLSIIGYELLYRSSAVAVQADVIDAVSATAQVISASLLELGMENIVGLDNKAFVNFPRSYLLNSSGMPVSPNNIVIEVLEDAGYDPILLTSLRRWSESGCFIALDDFVFDSKLVPFVELADYIKLDILALGKDGFHKQMKLLEGFDVKIIAEKVETWDEFEFCRLLGVEYFQGYFFEKPEMMTGKALKVNNVTLLQLMSSLLDVSISIDKLEQIVSQDTALVHKLLRYLNSPMTGLAVTVESVRLAITLVGIDHLKYLTNILLMSEIVGDEYVLLEQIMIRAKHVDLLSKRLGYKDQEKFFLVGMLSMIDLYMDMELESILAELPLSVEIVEGILHKAGDFGEVLKLVVSYEDIITEDIPEDYPHAEALRGTYLGAIKWVDEFLSIMR